MNHLRKIKKEIEWPENSGAVVNFIHLSLWFDYDNIVL